MENLEIVTALFPAVAKTNFGKKMFNRIAPIVEKLSDATAKDCLQQIEKHLRYHPSASPHQILVFEFLADLASNCQNWRDFAQVYGELQSPHKCLDVLGDDGKIDFFQPY